MNLILTPMQKDFLVATCLRYAKGNQIEPRTAVAASHLQILCFVRIETGPALLAHATKWGHLWVREHYLGELPSAEVP